MITGHDIGEVKKLWPKKDPEEGGKFWEMRTSVNLNLSGASFCDIVRINWEAQVWGLLLVMLSGTQNDSFFLKSGERVGRERDQIKIGYRC